MANILFLGEIGIGQTSRMRMRALARLGHTVRGVQTNEPWTRAGWVARQIQRRLQRGPIVSGINRSVLQAAREFRPDLVWAEKQEYLRADTIEELRRLGARLVHFTPDPYYSLRWKQSKIMNEAIRHFDVLVYCKSYERDQYLEQGKPLVYMPLGYCDEVHRPVPSDDQRWKCEVGFLGGWEPRRERMLHGVAHAGVRLNIRGGYWDFLCDGKWTLRRQIILAQLAGSEQFAIHRDDLLAGAYQGGEVYSDDYSRAVSGAGIGLGFLRQVCPDQHTTRTFEIPACGSMLLADRTAEHLGFFEEGREAEFFASSDELLDKVRFYCANELFRRRIAAAGRARCETGKYAYVHRLRAAMAEIDRI